MRITNSQISFIASIDVDPDNAALLNEIDDNSPNLLKVSASCQLPDRGQSCAAACLCNCITLVTFRN